MPQSWPDRGTSEHLGPLAALALLALVPASPASAAERHAVVFKPAKTSKKAVTFRVRGVKPQRVLRASLVRKGKVRRRIGREQARRVVRRGVLRVPVRSSKGRRAARILGSASARRRALWVRRVARTSVKLKVVADTRAPETRITAGPSDVTESHEAEFRFSADERRSSFECRVDSFSWRSCSSPILYVEVPDGDHTFSVRARDRYGNVDGTPAVRGWTVDSELAKEPTVVPEQEAPDQPTDGDARPRSRAARNRFERSPERRLQRGRRRDHEPLRVLVERQHRVPRRHLGDGVRLRSAP